MIKQPQQNNYLLSVIIAVVVFCFTVTCKAQKHDYNWLAGYNSWAGIIDSNAEYGITKLDFNINPTAISYDSLGMNFDHASCTISDKDGNLLFYTNGNYIANKWDEKIPNSDSLSFGYVSYIWAPSTAINGQRIARIITSIPAPVNNNIFYVFHILVDTLNTTSTQAGKVLYQTVLNPDDDFGKGYITEKKNVLVDDLPGLEMTLIKHANGRDWWLIGQLRKTNCFYRLLIAKDGIVRLANQCISNVYAVDEVCGSIFSPDGNKLGVISYHKGLSIYDFDRCSGELSNQVDITIPEVITSNLYVNISFSPSSRFIYITATDRIYQYDTWAADIAASKDTVAWYDGFYDHFVSLKTMFTNSQLAPDGKIYIGTGNTTRYYHLIDKPDEKGDACNVLQHSVRLKSFVGGVPYYPNYRLGALAGSGCDTLISDIESQEERAKTIQVFPNPATDFVTVDYGNIVWERYNTVSLKLTNAIGQVVYQSVLPRYSGLHKVDVSELPAGLYHAEVLGDGRMIGVSKVVVK